MVRSVVSRRWRARRDARRLKVVERALAGLGREPPEQGASADLEGGRQRDEVVAVGQVLVELSHDPAGELASGLRQESSRRRTASGTYARRRRERPVRSSCATRAPLCSRIRASAKSYMALNAAVVVTPVSVTTNCSGRTSVSGQRRASSSAKSQDVVARRPVEEAGLGEQERTDAQSRRRRCPRQHASGSPRSPGARGASFASRSMSGASSNPGTTRTSTSRTADDGQPRAARRDDTAARRHDRHLVSDVVRAGDVCGHGQQIGYAVHLGREAARIGQHTNPQHTHAAPHVVGEITANCGDLASRGRPVHRSRLSA